MSSNPTLTVIGGLFLITYAALALIAVRRPLLLRIAIRELIRRPLQSALVVVGLMVASSSLAAALLVGDVFNEWLTANVLREWGRVDVLVTANGTSFSRSVADQLGGDSSLREDIAGLQAGVELTGSVADLDQQLERSGVRLTAFDPVAQPAFGAFVLGDGTRTCGEGLGTNGVLVSQKLASLLDARPGDRLRISLSANGVDRSSDLTVAGIAAPVGPGLYGLVPSVFMTLDGIRPLIGSSDINVVRISARGDGQQELDNSPRVASLVQTTLPTTTTPFRVTAAKAVDVYYATEQSAIDRAVWIVLSLLAIAAALMLAVNLALALADERRPRLAVLRAMGLTRTGLIQTSALEGAIFSLAGAVLSIGPGLLLGLLIVKQFARFGIPGPSPFSLPGADYVFNLPVKLSTVALGIALATLLLMGTVLAAAVRTSRMTIVAAIRDLPEPTARRGWRWPSVIGFGALAVGGVLALAVPAGPKSAGIGANFHFFGGIALISLVVRLVRGLMPQTLRISLAGLALITWSLIWSRTADTTPFFAILGMVLGVALIALANLRVLDAAVGLLGSRRTTMVASLRPALAYVTRRPLRTGLTIVGFGLLVAVMLTIGAIFNGAALFLSDRPPYDVRVTAPTSSSVALPSNVESVVSRQLAIPTRIYAGPLQSVYGRHENAVLNLYTVTPDFVADPPVALRSRSGMYTSDAALWRAMLHDPHIMVSNNNNGAAIVLAGSQGPVRLATAGLTAPVVAPASALDGIIASPDALQPFANRPAGVTLFLKLKPGANAAQVAKDIERSEFALGVEAVPTQELFGTSIDAVRSIERALQLFLGVGLMTGVLTLGILALRAVIERRHAIGLLRSLGFRRTQVVAGQFAENAVTASIGVLLGLTVGGFWALGSVRALVSTSFGLTLDWLGLGLMLGLTYGTLILVTAIPGLQAARLAPGEALRITD